MRIPELWERNPNQKTGPSALDAALYALLDRDLKSWLALDDSQFRKAVRSADRLRALGLVEGVFPHGLRTVRTRETAVESLAAARVWIAVRALGTTFSPRDVEAVFKLSGGKVPAATHVASYLRMMDDKKCVKDSAPGEVRLTPTGREFVDYFAAIVKSLRAKHPFRIAYDEVIAAAHDWSNRVYDDGSAPGFLSLFPDRQARRTDAAAPPVPGDRRSFVASGTRGRGKDDGDRIVAAAYDALSLGPMDAAALAGALGVTDQVACRIICRLAAEGAVKDVTPGAAARSAAWEAFCDAVAEGLDEGADPEEKAVAVDFLKDRLDGRVAGMDEPEYPSRIRGTRTPHPRVGSFPLPKTTKSAFLERIAEKPSTLSELAEMRGISRIGARLAISHLRRTGLAKPVSGWRYAHFDHVEASPEPDAEMQATAAPGM